MTKWLTTIRLCLLATVLTAGAAEAKDTIHYSGQDLRTDTAIAVYFADGNARTGPYFFSMSGDLMQMVMCKATFDSQKTRILVALRKHPDFRDRPPVAAACERTGQTPLDPRSR